MKMNLKTKSTLFISSSVLMVTVVGLVFSYIWIRHLLYELISRDQVVMASHLADMLSDRLDANAEWLQALASSNEIISLQKQNSNKISEQESEKLFTALKLFEPDPDVFGGTRVLSIVVLNRNGNVLAGNGGEEDHVDVNFSRFKMENDYYISKELQYDRSDMKYKLEFALPSFDSNGVLTGACLIGVTAGGIVGPIGKFHMGSLGYVDLISPSGELVYSSRGNDAAYVRLPADVMSRILSASEKWLIEKSPHKKNEEVFLAFAPITSSVLARSNLSWILVIEDDARKLFSPLVGFSIRALIISVLMVLLGVILGRRFGRKLSKPLEDLTDVMREITNGKYDRCIFLKTGDEFEGLASAFNEMCERVTSQNEETESLMQELTFSKNRLQDYSDELEENVKARTVELEQAMKELGDSREVVLSVLKDTNETKKKLEDALLDLQRKEEELIQAGKLAGIGEMAAGIAHEINNPLAGILGYTQLQLERDNIDEELKLDLKNIELEVKRCVVIIERLLDFARPKPIEMKQISVNDIVEKALLIVSYSITREDVSIRKNLGLNLPMVLGDAQSLQQVFMNMVINAFNAITKKGNIIVETFTGTSDGKTFVCISFTDTGAGIPKENLSRIFEPFFSTSYKTGKKGAGLGLSVSHSIILQHGGRIEVQSEVGLGTNFRVILPAIQELEV